MLNCYATRRAKKSIPIFVVTAKMLPAWRHEQNQATQNWLTSTGFRTEGDSVNLIPDASGHLSKVLCYLAKNQNFWSIGHLPQALPNHQYSLEIDAKSFDDAAIAWGLGAYQFTRYKKATRESAQLLLPTSCDSENIINTVESIYLVRDLINTPTDDMGPSELAGEIVKLGKQYHAKIKQIIGEDLLKQNYPAIHTVGRASDDPPRLLDMRWGNKKHPKVTLVGKGVCFDSGGLDIKPSSAMQLMKKDMAGAAHVMGLARMIMEARLPINLRVLIPIVENAISGNAYRPGDIIRSRSGITIEVGNTDAEGRVILADALSEAISEKPDLLIDITTLTGAAKVALGTDLPALFSNQDALADDLIKQGNKTEDPLWRLPLFAPYREALNSPIADINNCTTDSYAGAITAALFLKEFVPDDIPWVHLDLMAWNLKTRSGRPQGGEAMALRALFSYLQAYRKN